MSGKAGTPIQRSLDVELILIILVVVLLFGGGWGYMNRATYGPGPSGIAGLLVLLLVLYLIFGGGRLGHL